MFTLVEPGLRPQSCSEPVSHAIAVSVNFQEDAFKDCTCELIAQVLKIN